MIMRTIIVYTMSPVKQQDMVRKGRAEPPRILSEQLLGRFREIVIVHNGREYRLRLTQSGKLILTA
jgi:hemin uptake protein HemP